MKISQQKTSVLSPWFFWGWSEDEQCEELRISIKKQVYIDIEMRWGRWRWRTHDFLFPMLCSNGSLFVRILFLLIVVYYIITPIFGITFRVPICLYHCKRALLYSFQKFGPHSNVPREVLGQQQSLNAVSSQVAKELQSLQQKDADSCFFFFWGGDFIWRIIPLSNFVSNCG